jgi:Ca2+-dependent lipid-binding protein
MDEEAETGDTKKRGVLAKVFGGCFPWLASSEELEVDAQEAAKFEGKPDSIVIVKIEKCVHLPAMINNESSNPYVEIKSRAKRKKTNVIKETLDPIFDAKFDMEHSRDDEVRDLQLTVYHSKFGGGKQFLGQHYVDLKNTKLGDKIQMREFSLKMEDGVTLVTTRDPGTGKAVESKIFMSWNISLKPEALVSVRVSNARNINSPDTRGLGFPFVKIKFDDRILKSSSATELQHPRWDQSISFDTLSILQLLDLPKEAKPNPKVVIEVWDSKAIGDDIFIGSCETDILNIRYETRSDMAWHRLTDTTRARRANVGEIKFSIAWGPNEPTVLTVQIEEGFALTKHLQSSLLQKGKRAKSFFSKQKDDDKQETLPSSFLSFSLDNTRKRKTKVIKENINPQWQEKHHFQVLQSELPTSMLVQCYHQHMMGEEFIGMVSVDLQKLELNRSSFVRW